MRNKHIQQITLSGLLIALAILIPMMMPLKLMIGASTYTFASHVPVFIAMFISPYVAIMVTLGSALGFFISMPFLVFLRAFSHLAFSIPGSLYLQKHTLKDKKQTFIFNFIIALIHGTAEFLVVTLISTDGLNATILWQFFIFLGLGTMIHSMVDFIFSLSILKGLKIIK